MTKEEAASIISGYEVYGCGYCLQGCDEVEEALRMAIDALRQETVIRCKDCSSRGMKNNYECYCRLLERWVSVNFHCGYGTRKEE